MNRNRTTAEPALLFIVIAALLRRLRHRGARRIIGIRE
jgi:hypothetical protein